MTDPIALAAQYVELSDRKQELQTKLNKIKDELSGLEEPLIDALLQRGVDRLTVSGATVYTSTTLWARSRGNHAAAVAALQKHGLDDLIILGPSRVSSYFREFEDLSQAPPELLEAFDVTERTRIGVRHE